MSVRLITILIWTVSSRAVIGQNVEHVCSLIYGEELMESYVERQLAVEHASQAQFDMKLGLLTDAVLGFKVEALRQSLTGEQSNFNKHIKGEKLELLNRAFGYVDQMDSIPNKQNCRKLDSASWLMQSVSTMITQEWKSAIEAVDVHLNNYELQDKREPRRTKALVGHWISTEEQFSDMRLHADGSVHDLNYKGDLFNQRYWFVKREALCFNVVDDVNSKLCYAYKFEKGLLFLKLKKDWTAYEKAKLPKAGRI